MKKLLIGFIVMAALTGPIGCAPRESVKVNLEHFQENPAAYEGKRVIFTTDIATLLKNPDLYHIKDVQISGVVKRGRHPGGFWGFNLEDEDGRGILCFETHYVHNPWYRADLAIKQAMNKKDVITVVGNFRKHLELELDWIEYGEETIDTDYKPLVHRVPYW